MEEPLRAPGGHSFLQIDGMDVDWGTFSNEWPHTYTSYYVGKGARITFQIVDWVDGDYGNNACHIDVLVIPVAPCNSQVAPRTIGFWKNHPDQWPVDSITVGGVYVGLPVRYVGGVTYTKDQALAILRSANAKDPTQMLTAQLIAAKLNVLAGACVSPSVLRTIDESDKFLWTNPLGSRPTGPDRDCALMLKDILDSFNNGH